MPASEGDRPALETFFKKPEIDLSGCKLIAIFTAHNEADRIPFFLDYYRRHGVRQFFAIDNNSTDGTRELLQGQKDVTYFFTSASYVESKAGRLWTRELADHYGMGRWCLTLDLDEQLVFPACERITIAQLCDYLDDHNYDGMFCVFLDMYSSKPLSEAIYTPGQPFLDVCDHFEVESYTLRQPVHFPHVQVFGGPRQRVFWEQGNRGMGPSMRKMPLVKWQPGFKYLYSTHSSSPIRLADITGCLLHFKFFSFFKSLAAREFARGDRVQKDHYEQYARLTEEQDISFMTPASMRLDNSTTLLRKGIMVCTPRYLRYARPLLDETSDRSQTGAFEQDLRNAIHEATAAATLKLSQLPLLWPLLGSNVDCGVLGVRDRTVTGWYCNRGSNALHIEIQALVDGSVVATAVTSHRDSGTAKLTAPQRAAIFELTIPEDVLAHRRSVQVALTATGDARAFADVMIETSGRISNAKHLDGVCHDSDAGRIRGWAVDKASPWNKRSVSIYIDGEFWRSVPANLSSTDTGRKGIGDGWNRFAVKLPDFTLDGRRRRVDVLLGGTNLHLRRSPLYVEGPSVRWQKRPQA